MTLTFNQPASWELDFYAHAARQMVERHRLVQEYDPIIAVVFNTQEMSVTLSYRKLDGTETELGVKYPANAVKTRHIGKLIESARELRREGFPTKLEVPA